MPQTYSKTFTTNDFILSEGIYVATILASTHQLGSVFHLEKALRLDADGTWDNILVSYEITSEGDFKLYTEEPMIVRTILATL